MIPKHTLAAAHQNSDGDASIPLWFRVSSLLLVGVAIALLLLILGDRGYRPNFPVVALVLVLLSLACAAYLHIHAWYQARRGSYATGREFTSVFQHVLDAILILDNHGVCLDANPAAFALLGVPPAVLIGSSFAQFYEDHWHFERLWDTFLEGRRLRGQTELLRANGSRVFVSYKAAANYLPGRHVLILCDTTERIAAQDSLRQSNERLQQISDNIHEIVWMMDASTKKVLVVNRAYETITGRSLKSIADDPWSYVDLIHPLDRGHVLAKLEETVRSGHFDEEFRIVRPDGQVRWVWVKANPLPHDADVIRKLVGTAQDITARKLAAADVARHLTEAQNAREQADAAHAEAEALRKATLALTQNLRMDAVLDTLLRCLLEIVPYDSASVILTETGGRLFVARESPPAHENQRVVTLELEENAFLQRVVLMKKSVHVVDTRQETDWRETKALANIRCWIAVPLIVGDTVLGLLSIGSARPFAFDADHFRRAKSLGIPAAVAIHNARLYEWAQIYADERQSLLKKADRAGTKSGEASDLSLPH